MKWVVCGFCLFWAVTLAIISITPCQVEDSVNCHWNAKERGNGQGTSFLNVLGYVIPV